jgi:hypothetical protein
MTTVQCGKQDWRSCYQHNHLPLIPALEREIKLFLNVKAFINGRRSIRTTRRQTPGEPRVIPADRYIK